MCDSNPDIGHVRVNVFVIDQGDLKNIVQMTLYFFEL